MPRPLRNLPRLVAGLLVLAVTLAVFAGTLSHEFTRWDDGTSIYQNPRLGPLGLESLKYAFTDVATTMRWIPLTLLSLSLTHTLHGLDPFGYHLHNWLLHGATALLVFLLLLELLGRRGGAAPGEAGGDPWTTACAALGALAWSLHPLRAEVEAWSNSRGHAQAGFFAVLSLLLYLRGRRPGAPERPPWRAAALPAACFLAALLSHPVALGVAPVFLLLDVHLGRLGGQAGWWTPAARRVLLEKLPFAAAAALVLAVTLAVRALFPGRWDPPVPLSEWGLFPRAMQATFAWIHYALVTLWPVGLQPAPTELIDFDPWAPAFLLRAALVVAATAAAFLLRRRWPAVLLLWLGWLVLLVPALGLTEHPMFACDRYTYLAGLVPALVVAAAASRLGATGARRLACGAVAAALLATLGSLSVAQARIWRDSVTLFQHMLPLLGEHPYRANIFAMLALAHRDRQEAQAAVAAARQAVLVEPESGELRAFFADLLMHAGRTEEAAAELGEAVRLDPTNAELRCQRASALLGLGQRMQAFAEVRAAFQLSPGARCVPWLLGEISADSPH